MPERGRSMKPKKWRCFHCDAVLTTRQEAAEHFGDYESCDPICKVDAVKFREMEREVRRTRWELVEETADCHREVYALLAKHRDELDRQEELGFARGVRDAKKDLFDAINAALEGDDYDAVCELLKIRGWEFDLNEHIAAKRGRK